MKDSKANMKQNIGVQLESKNLHPSSTMQLEFVSKKRGMSLGILERIISEILINASKQYSLFFIQSFETFSQMEKDNEKLKGKSETNTLRCRWSLRTDSLLSTMEPTL